MNVFFVSFQTHRSGDFIEEFYTIAENFEQAKENLFLAQKNGKLPACKSGDFVRILKVEKSYV